MGLEVQQLKVVAAQGGHEFVTQHYFLPIAPVPGDPRERDIYVHKAVIRHTCLDIILRKTSRGIFFTPVRMATIANTTTHADKDVIEREIFIHSYHKCNVVKALWKPV